MSVNYRDHYVPLPPIEKTSIRYFVDDPDTGWQRISTRRFDDIDQGKICAPEWAGKAVRCATTTVAVDRRKITGLCCVMISNWRIGPDGFAGSDAVSGPTADYSGTHQPKFARTPDADPTEADILAIKRCLGLGSRKVRH
jgi:hypothetical protein